MPILVLVALPETALIDGFVPGRVDDVSSIGADAYVQDAPSNIGDLDEFAPDESPSRAFAPVQPKSVI